MTQPSPLKLSCIIDDDDVYINLVTKIIDLKKLSENTLVFKNGKEALHYFIESFEETSQTPFPEIILLDLNMPVMDGWNFLSEFTKIQTPPHFKTTIYIVSSSINKEEIERAKSIELVTDYLLKPIDISTFESLFKEAKVSA